MKHVFSIIILAILFLFTSCSFRKNKKSYKCLSCKIYLHKDDNEVFSLFHESSEQKMEKVIEGISKIYWINCKGLVAKDSTYYVITNSDGIINQSNGLGISDAEKYFKTYFTENQNLKFNLCSSLYKFLPPRSTCE